MLLHFFHFYKIVFTSILKALLQIIRIDKVIMIKIKLSVDIILKVFCAFILSAFEKPLALFEAEKTQI